MVRGRLFRTTRASPAWIPVTWRSGRFFFFTSIFIQGGVPPVMWMLVTFWSLNMAKNKCQCKKNHFQWLIYTRWGPPVISWFIFPINDRYITIISPIVAIVTLELFAPTERYHQSAINPIKLGWGVPRCEPWCWNIYRQGDWIGVSM